MINEGFADALDSSLIDYSSNFEKQDQIVYDRQCALNWVFTNCCDVYGYKLNPKYIRYNEDSKTIDILKNGISMRGHNYGKIGKGWTYTNYKDEGEDITEIPDYVKFNACIGSCDFDENHLKTLKGSPRVIIKDSRDSYGGSGAYGDFYVCGNELENLEGFPEYISGDFDCNRNPLKSFDGINLKWVEAIYDGHTISYPSSLVDQWLDLVRKYANRDKLEHTKYANEIILKYINDVRINESFSDALDSSLIDYSSDFEKADKIRQIRNWVENSLMTKDYYDGYSGNSAKRTPRYEIDYKINDDFTIDTFDDILVHFTDRWYGVDTKSMKYPTELPDYINFNISHGDFILQLHDTIESLRGFPKEVYGSFYVWGQQLKTLEGGPTIVTKCYNACSNKLTSLKGAPKIIGTADQPAFFNVYDNKLKNLIGGPEIVYGSYSVQNNNLESIEGYPKLVDGEFNIKHNPKLSSIDELLNDKTAHINTIEMTTKQKSLLLYRKRCDKIKNTTFNTSELLGESFSDVLDSSLVNYSNDFEKLDIDHKIKIRKDWCNKHIFIYNPYRIGSGTEGTYTGIPANIKIADDLSIEVFDSMYIDYFSELEIPNDPNGCIQLPDYINFNVVHGDFCASGDGWGNFKGFPKIVEGTLYLDGNYYVKSFEHFPEKVWSFEYSEAPYIKDMFNYFPDIIEGNDTGNDTVNKKEILYSINEYGMNPKNVKAIDDYIYYNLLKKYKGKVDSIGTLNHHTDTDGWDFKLNESFNDALDSSLMDYSEDLAKSDKIHFIKNWIENHVLDYGVEDTNFKGPHEYKYKINDDFSVDIEGSILVQLDPDIHEIPIKFNEVNGHFIVIFPQDLVAVDYIKELERYRLYSLKNIPRKVKGNFNIASSRLDNLVGSPLFVEGDFNANYTNITSIRGITPYIAGSIHLSYNNILNAEEILKYISPNYKRNIFILHNKSDDFYKSAVFDLKDRKFNLISK